MGTIGAMEHQKLYEDFIKTNQIDTSDLSSFVCETFEALESQYARYPFNEYNKAFYGLAPLQDYLVNYVRKHIDKF